jgi:hypothetical protein
VCRRDDDEEFEPGVLDLCRDALWVPPSGDGFGARADSLDGCSPSDEGFGVLLFSFGGRPRLRGTIAGDTVGCAHPGVDELAEGVSTEHDDSVASS